MASDVKMTASLVATAGLALQNYPHGTSQELQRMSGTLFSTMLPRSVKDSRKFWNCERKIKKMKTNKIYWLLGILLLMTSEVYSQKSATAIMNVSVKIISGSTITEVNQVDIDVNSKKVSYVEFDISPQKTLKPKLVAIQHLF